MSNPQTPKATFELAFYFQYTSSLPTCDIYTPSGIRIFDIILIPTHLPIIRSNIFNSSRIFHFHRGSYLPLISLSVFPPVLQQTATMSIPRVETPPGNPISYIVPGHEGESMTIPGTKTAIRILASAKETEGLFSVFKYDGVLGDAPGFHYHNGAHDIFMCTKGSLKVWAGDKCRILSPGDFCSVPPVRNLHLYTYSPNMEG